MSSPRIKSLQTSKELSPLVVDTSHSREQKTRDYNSKIPTPTQQLISSNSKMSTSSDIGEQRIYKNSAEKIRAIHLVNSKYGAKLPNTGSNLVIDTRDDIATGGLPKEKSPRISPSLFKQSTNKVSQFHRPLSPEAAERNDQHLRRQKSPAALAAAVAKARLQLSPTTPMAKVLSGKSRVDDKTAARVSNFIDSLHQTKGKTTIPRVAGNSPLPPKSPSAAHHVSKNRYSSILSNARSVIASSPVSRINVSAAESTISTPSDIAIANQKVFLCSTPRRNNGLDSDYSINSDDDSSCFSFATFKDYDSTQKDVGEFIDTLNRENNHDVEADTKLLSSLKAKLNSGNEIEAAPLDDQRDTHKKAENDVAGKEEKMNDTKTSTKLHHVASNQNIKKDVHHYAILSQIQKAFQSDNPSLLMGNILADAGKRGLKLALVTEMIKEERMKAKACKIDYLMGELSMNKSASKNERHETCKPANLDQPAADAVRNDKLAEHDQIIQTEDTLLDSDENNNEKEVSFFEEQPSPSFEISATPLPVTNSNVPDGAVSELVDDLEPRVSCGEILNPPFQTKEDNPSVADTNFEDMNYDPDEMSEVEARIRKLARSATPSIEFGDILADAKRRGLPPTYLIRFYQQEREKVANAAVKAAALVIVPKRSDEESSFISVVDSCSQNCATEFGVKEKLARAVKEAVRKSNPSEVLGKILVDAKNEGVSAEWLFELYTKERMYMQIQTAAANENSANLHISNACSSESEVSEVSEIGKCAFSNVLSSTSLPQEITRPRITEVDDFFSKFSLNAQSKENIKVDDLIQALTASISEVTSIESEISDFGIAGEKKANGNESARITSTSVGENLCEVEVTVSAFSKDGIDENNNLIVQSVKNPKSDGIWKSPLQTERLSQRKLSRGGRNKPINGVAAAAALTEKRRLRGLKRTHLKKPPQERTKAHSGYFDIDFYSLYESTTCHAEDEEIDKAPWEYRDVRQRFLSEKSLVERNWFGTFESERGNDRVPNPVVCPKSLQISVTKIPETGEWNEAYFTTWKSRRDNPNNLVTFTEADLPTISMNSSGTSSTSTALAESHSYEKSVDTSDTTYNSQKKPVLIEIGNLVSVRFSGERVSKVHYDYTSSLRRSRWRKKYMRGEFAFDAEM